MSDLEEMAREVIDATYYMTLGTSEADGSPRVSPVYFTHAGHRDFYWVSSPAARHSRNVAARPAVSAVIFDSTAAVGRGRAVYLTGRAAVVPDEELPERCAAAFANLRPGGARAFAPEELAGEADLRLYLLTATRHEVHIPGSDPSHGTGIDTRREVVI